MLFILYIVFSKLIKFMLKVQVHAGGKRGCNRSCSKEQLHSYLQYALYWHNNTVIANTRLCWHPYFIGADHHFEAILKKCVYSSLSPCVFQPNLFLTILAWSSCEMAVISHWIYSGKQLFPLITLYSDTRNTQRRQYVLVPEEGWGSCTGKTV